MSITLREFDRLTEKGEVYRGGTCICEEDAGRRAVYAALRELIAERRAAQEEDDGSAFFSISYHKASKSNCIIIQNYVGVVCLPNGEQVEILPKVSSAKDEKLAEEQDKELFIQMLLSMPEFERWKKFGMVNQQARRLPIADIFISMFEKETAELVKRGLKSAYMPQEGNLPYLKGRLLVAQNMRVNRFHPECFMVGYDEFVPDMPQNRLLKATLLKLMRLAKTAEVVRAIRRLLPAFEQVQASVHYDKDFQQVVSSRSTREYDNLMHWAKVFLANKSFTPFSGNSSALSLLFPMEKLFESYVAQQLRKFLPAGFRLSAQDQEKYLLGEFLLKPDIVVREPERTRLILDTKWKRLSDNGSDHYGVKQGDIYQMFAYSLKYNVEKVILLYPKEAAREKLLTWTETEIAPYRVTISAQTISLSDMEKEDYVRSLMARWGLVCQNEQK